MTRIIAYSAPFTMPFVVLGLLRLMYFLAGGNLPSADNVVYASTALGVFSGCCIAIAYNIHKWEGQ